MLKKTPAPVKDEAELAQDVLINEVSDDLHAEQLMDVWNKYKYALVGAIILIVGGLALMEIYFSMQMKTRLAESDTYEQAAVLYAQGQTDAAMNKYASLQDGNTNYRYLADMRRAGILFDEGKQAEGVAILNALRQNMDAPETVRAMATLGYVSQELEKGNAAELQSALNPYMTVGSPWYGLAAEMSIMLLVREGDLEKANRVLDETLSMTAVPLSIRERLSIMKKALEG